MAFGKPDPAMAFEKSVKIPKKATEGDLANHADHQPKFQVLTRLATNTSNPKPTDLDANSPTESMDIDKFSASWNRQVKRNWGLNQI